MSSIMRARNALTGRGEEAEVIGGVLFELKVAGPSMLGIGCPDRHPLPLIPHTTIAKNPRTAPRGIPRERVRSMPHSGRSSMPPGSVQLGGIHALFPIFARL